MVIIKAQSNTLSVLDNKPSNEEASVAINGDEILIKIIIISRTIITNVLVRYYYYYYFINDRLLIIFKIY